MKIVAIGDENQNFKWSERDRLRLKAAVRDNEILFVEDPVAFAEALLDADVGIGHLKLAQGDQLGKRLHWFHSWSAGVDSGPLEQLIARGDTVTTSKGNGGIPLAEQTFLLMLMAARKAFDWAEAQRRHKWERHYSTELYGKTLGLIGLGHIGIEVARRASAFGMRCLAVRRQPGLPADATIEKIVGPEGLDGVLSQSDFIAVTAALTPETRGMIGDAQFRRMKPSAIYVCVSRGEIADADALLSALREKRIAAAGLDAHSIEPLPADSPFWDLPNTIVTPHNGATSDAKWERTLNIVVENLERWGSNRPLINLVDPVTRY